MTAFARLSGLVAVAAVVMMGGPGAARADDVWGLHEVWLGVLDHDTDNLWSGFSREDGVDINAEVLFDDVGGFGGGQFHPAVGASVNTQGGTSKVYGGLRWRYGLDNGLFFGLGLGAALHNGETAAQRDRKGLGTRLLFHIPAEVGYHVTPDYAVAVYFDHISNGYTVDANEGLDTLGIRIGRRF